MLGIPTVHSFIPNWHPLSVDYLESNMMAPIDQIDHARDGFHYGRKTHLLLAQQITNLLAV